MSTESQKVVAGVLQKYVNLTKGFRDRLFVLKDEKLDYYKLSGKHAVNVQQVLDHYDPTADITLIGAKILLIQNEHARKDDRLAWMTALTHARTPSLGLVLAGADSLPFHSGAQTDVLPTNGTTSEPTIAALAKTAAELQARSDAVIDAPSRRLIAALQQQVRQVAVAVEDRDSQIRQLMDEGRQLQTALVAESQLLDGLDGADLGTDRATSSSQDDEVEFDDDQSVADSLYPSQTYRAAEHEGEYFYDAREPSKRTSALGAAVPFAVDATSRPVAAAAPKSATAAMPKSVTTAAPKPVAGAAPQTAAAAPPAPSADEAAKLSKQWLQEQPQVQRRLKLPEPKEKQKSVSLWSVIKECIGKDLTRICLPVYFNEPLSALQRIGEEFEYSYILDRAAACAKGSQDRLMWIAVFAMSGYAATNGRTCKPFNPLLGETFEYVDTQRKFRFLAEKVVHHPTVLAAHVEGMGWTADADLEVKSKFWGRCIELKPVAYIQLSFDDGEIVTWNKVTSTINNLIIGKIYLEHSGTMRTQSNLHKKEMSFKFKDSGSMFGGSKHLVSGAMYEGKKEIPGYRMSGVWSESIVNDSTSEQLWQASPPAPDPTRYNLTQFSIQLNEVTVGLKEALPPTDCRLRPDQAALEHGLFDKANAEKQRLEQKQRKARKEAEEGVPIQSRWFQPIPGAARGDELAYKYTGGYWEQRKAGQFTDCRDIFG